MSLYRSKNKIEGFDSVCPTSKRDISFAHITHRLPPCLNPTVSPVSVSIKGVTPDTADPRCSDPFVPLTPLPPPPSLTPSNTRAYFYRRQLVPWNPLLVRSCGGGRGGGVNESKLTHGPRDALEAESRAPTINSKRTFRRAPVVFRASMSSSLEWFRPLLCNLRLTVGPG